MIDNSINIFCSRNCRDFRILFDGMGNYYLYHQDKLIKEIAEATTPKQIYKDNNLLETLQTIKENYKHEIILTLINEITAIIGDSAKKMNTVKSILTDLVYSLKDAEKDAQYNKEYFNNAPSIIKQKANEIADLKGYDRVIFDNEISIEDITEFNEIMNKYETPIEMLKENLKPYVDNEENMFKGIINCLGALMGYTSRIIVLNGGSTVGKSEYIETLSKLILNYVDLGSSTPATIRRREREYFDRKIVYLGDKGLKGTDDEEFKGLLEVFGGLVSENKFKRDLIIGDKIMDFDLKSDGVMAFYSQPVTNFRTFGAGDQYSTRSSFLTINPVKDGLEVALNIYIHHLDNTNFCKLHSQYINYIIKNPLEIKLTEEIVTKVWQNSNDDLRTMKYLMGLFQAYCQYTQISNPLTTDVSDFLEIFKPRYNITDIEALLYEKLYNNLNVLKSDDLEYLIADDGGIQYNDLLTQRNNRKDKSFFTAKQIQTYFRADFKHKKNLKDTIDLIPGMLKNLFDAELLQMLNWQYNGENVYYIPYNKDMVK